MGFLKIPIWSAILACALSIGLVRAASPTEFQLKAVFLYHFTQFVEWPEDAFDTPDAPLVIGVLGEDPFGTALDEAVEGERVRGRPILVQRYGTVDQIERCHILFVNLPGRADTEAALRALGDQPLLTVGDSNEFARAGGVIGFVTVGNKIRLQINLDAARQADLEISSKLLRPARIVRNR
jgi:hypothetical protein